MFQYLYKNIFIFLFEEFCCSYVCMPISEYDVLLVTEDFVVLQYLNLILIVFANYLIALDTSESIWKLCSLPKFENLNVSLIELGS